VTERRSRANQVMLSNSRDSSLGNNIGIEGNPMAGGGGTGTSVSGKRSCKRRGSDRPERPSVS